MMKLDDRLIVLKLLVPMIPETQTQTQTQTHKQPKKSLKLNRELSWQVASSLLVSFKYAWAGLSYAFETQRNFRIHTFIGSAAIAFSLFLHLENVKIAVIALTIALVLALELLNTAIESVVDLTIGHSYHELAKIAKDCAAGAVLVSAIASGAVAGVLFLPPVWAIVEPFVISR